MVDEYFEDIVNFLNIGMAPQGYCVSQKKQLVLKASYYQLISGQLYNIRPNEILRQCVLEHGRPMILDEAHDGVAGGHYIGKLITQKY